MKRRANGTVRRRPNGTWEARGIIAGKRRSFYAGTQKEVLTALHTAQKASDDGQFFEPSKLTLSQWLNTWLDTYVRPSCKPLTLSAYASNIRTHVVPALGKIRLSALTPTHLQQFYNSLLDSGSSAKTVRNVHGVLREALARAVKLRYIALNPADACSLPRVTKHEIKPLTDAEVRMFLAASRGNEMEDFFKVVLFTGMREGEACGLPWSAVDFIHGTITVKQQLCKEKERGGKHFIGIPKNGKSRVLTVPPFILDILNEVKAKQEANRALCGAAWQNEFDLVFTDAIGHFYVPQTTLKRFKRIAAEIGRPDARLHDLRHTYAVVALQMGDPIKTVQENLGHATAAFTLDVYGHVSDRMRRESAERMQNYFYQTKA